MTLADAFKTLQSGKLTAQQLEAVKIIKGFYARANKVRSSDQGAFIKLYTYCFMKFSLYYKAHPDQSTIPQKELHKLLDRSFESLCEEAKDEFNHLQLIESMNQVGRPPLEKYSRDEVKKQIKHMALLAAVEFNNL